MPSEPISALPALYDGGDPESTTPSLKGICCKSCGRVAFPPQSYGCERCGASGENLEACLLSSRGRLISFARVNMHHGKDIKVPFTIGEIKLEDGPVIRVTLVEDNNTAFSLGQLVEGILVPVTKDGSEQADKVLSDADEEHAITVELRFRMAV